MLTLLTREITENFNITASLSLGLIYNKNLIRSARIRSLRL
nr:MAG TPA: hypothetical protein [Caudoviricetes sp.]